MRYYFIIFIILLIFTGCDRLRRWDDKAGEMFFSKEAASSTPGLWEDISTGKGDEPIASSSVDRVVINVKDFVKNLGKEQKDKIENWLSEKGLNRYGDPDGTYYTGGTPLFNEATGNTIERFEYIINKHKELIDIIRK